jgi:hypothetical protein
MSRRFALLLFQLPIYSMGNCLLVARLAVTRGETATPDGAGWDGREQERRSLEPCLPVFLNLVNDSFTRASRQVVPDA